MIESFLGHGWIDGNVVEVASIIVGFVYASLKRFWQKKQALFMSLWANGLALFPLTLLALSPFNSQMLPLLLEAGKIPLFMAGTFAMVSIWKSD